MNEYSLAKVQSIIKKYAEIRFKNHIYGNPGVCSRNTAGSGGKRL